VLLYGFALVAFVSVTVFVIVSWAETDPEFGKGGCALLKRLKTKKKKKREKPQGGVNKLNKQNHYEVKVHNYYSHL